MQRLIAVLVGFVIATSLAACSSGDDLIADADLRWEGLPSIPVGARNGHSTIWTGDRIVLWGGGSEIGQGSAEGVVLDPATRSWKTLPPAPISGRWFHGAIWTGGEMIVWGGRHPGLHDDGAAYDPDSDTWRVISPSPLRGRSAHSVVWTGSEMVVFGGHISPDNNDYIGDAAAYDPDADVWRMLPESGLSERMGAASIWTGEELLVWGGANTTGWLDDGAIYSPHTDSWRPMAPSPLDPREDAAVRIDDEWVVFTGGIHNADTFEVPSARYHPATNRWDVLDDDSTEVWPLSPGEHVGLGAAGTTVEIDGEPVTIPPIPAGVVSAVATFTGDALVILGGEESQDTPGDFAFVVQLRR